MSLAYYQTSHPLQLLQRWQNDLGQFYGDDARAESSSATAEWVPNVDIDEHADRFVLSADVPGVDPESIELALEDGVLTLSGSRPATVSEEGVQQRRSERSTGRFYRRFTLPDTVDAEAVTATGRLGVLEVIIPKRSQSQARRIDVQVAN